MVCYLAHINAHCSTAIKGFVCQCSCQMAAVAGSLQCQQHPPLLHRTIANTASFTMIRYYKERPEWWAEASARNMRLDSSWGRSSEAYLELYRTMGQQ